MLLAFEDWQEDFESAILDRGWGYYEEERVVSLKRRGDKVSAVVQGTADYDVEITFDGDMITDLDCDCPYAVDGNLCKHMAAVLYALEDEPLASVSAPKEDWPALLAPLSPEELRSLLLHLLQNDRTVQDKVRLYLAPQAAPLVVFRAEQQLQDIVDKYSSGDDYISYEDGSDFADAVVTFLGDHLSILSTKDPLAALTILNSVIELLDELAMDGSNGEHGLIIDDCLYWWQTLYAAADASLRAKMWQTFTADWSIWRNYDSDAAWEIVTFCVEQGAGHDVLVWLDARIHAQEGQVGRDSYQLYQLQQDILQRAALMEELSYPLKEIAAYLRQYIIYDDVRLALIRLEMTQDRHQEALALIEDALKPYTPTGLQEQYCQLRLEIWRQSDNTAQYKQGLLDYLTHFAVRDLTAYQQLKALCTPEEWPALAEAVLAYQGQGRCKSSTYLDMLIEEGREQEVLAHFAQTHDLQGLKHYASQLCARYPQETADIFRTTLTQQAAAANCRNDYKRLTSELRALRQYPGGADLIDELVSLWRAQYKRRPAMMEELGKL